LTDQLASPIRVLCVDDHRLVREGIALIIDREPDMTVVGSAASGADAIALFKHFVEGPLRDPASLNKPSTHALDESLRIGAIASDGLLGDVHWGLIFGLVACLAAGVWLSFTSPGFALRVVGGNARTARLVGLPTNRLIVLACALGGACAGLAGAIEVAAVHTSANASVIAGLGYTGILVSFVARHNPWAIPPVALLFGGFAAAGSLLQRRLGLPDASVLVLQGFAFVLILAAEALRGRLFDLLWPRALLQVRAPAAIGAAS
jgi:simple sugar transport system permease protein